MSLGDLQACPWCAFVGTPALFDLHMAHHEQTWIADREELAKAQEEIRRLKAQLKERQKDYSKTIKTMAEINAEAQRWGMTTKGVADMIEQAWNIIANAGLHRGGWDNEDPEWVQVAIKYRDEMYHPWLTWYCATQPGNRPMEE